MQFSHQNKFNNKENIRDEHNFFELLIDICQSNLGYQFFLHYFHTSD
jgi:hypothetical protein